MKIIIIGSKGFIGTNAFHYFQSLEGVEVWGADVVVEYDSQRYFTIDASDSDFRQIFESQFFDVCINCSGAASVPDSLLHPMRDYILNTVNVFRMLDAIRQFQPACKFINLSSAAVYGNPERLPISENEAEAPMSPYGYHKKAADELCREFFNFFGVATCSLRIFSVYGNGLAKQLFWDLSKKASTSKHLTLFGTGEESRDFIHITDLVRSIKSVLDKGPFNGQSVNIANGEEVFIKDAVSLFLKALDWDGTVTFSGESRKGDPKNWKADISILRQYGYVQQKSMSQGLKEYAAWIKESL